MDEKFLIDTEEFVKQNIKLVLKSGTSGGITNMSAEDKKKRTNTIFSKHKTIKTVGLEDFQIMKVLGRGSFGKVCLVQYKPTKE